MLHLGVASRNAWEDPDVEEGNRNAGRAAARRESARDKGGNSTKAGGGKPDDKGKQEGKQTAKAKPARNKAKPAKQSQQSKHKQARAK